MTTIEIPPADLRDIIHILATKANEERQRATILVQSVEGIPQHPNHQIAECFLSQAKAVDAIVEMLEAQV